MMAPEAYVLINTEYGYEEKVFQKVKEIEGVKEAYRVLDLYDILVRVSGKSEDILDKKIRNEIRKVENIRSTLTFKLL